MVQGPDFGYTPAMVAELTDWQLENEYIIPAKDRADRLEAMRKDLPPPPTRREREARQGEPGKGGDNAAAIQPRAYIVGVLCMLGMTPEQANKEYDRQLAENLKIAEQRKANGNAGGRPGSPEGPR